jgi:hypothetical protein
MRIPALFAAALLPMSVGCLQEVDYVDDTNATDLFGSDYSRSDYADITSQIKDATISGQYGPNETFADGTPATQLSGYTDGTSSNVTVISERSNGTMGMLIVTTWDSSLLTIPAGTYTSSSMSYDSPVSVTVCATEFDAPADDAIVVIADDPSTNERTVTVEAVVNGDYGLDNRENPALGDFSISR